MRHALRSACANAGCSRHRLYIAGTISVCVTRSRCISAMNGSALNAGTITVVPASCSIVAMIAISPVTWLAGTASADTSPGRSFMQTW
jgi:hypothetical protein